MKRPILLEDVDPVLGSESFPQTVEQEMACFQRVHIQISTDPLEITLFIERLFGLISNNYDYTESLGNLAPMRDLRNATNTIKAEARRSNTLNLFDFASEHQSFLEASTDVIKYLRQLVRESQEPSVYRRSVRLFTPPGFVSWAQHRIPAGLREGNHSVGVLLLM